MPLSRLGATFTELRAYNEAVAAFREAIDLAPNDSELRCGLATVLLAIDKPELAMTQLDAALALRQEPRTYSLLGVANDLIGRHDVAQQNYADGLRLAPDNLPLRNNLGLSQALSGTFDTAIATLSAAAESPKATARTRQNLALVYGLSGDNAKAASVARADLDEASMKSNLAYYAMLRGMDDRARAAAIIGARAPLNGDQAAAPSPSPPAPQAEAAPVAAPVEAVEATPLAIPAMPAPAAPSSSRKRRRRPSRRNRQATARGPPSNPRIRVRPRRPRPPRPAKPPSPRPRPSTRRRKRPVPRLRRHRPSRRRRRLPLPHRNRRRRPSPPRPRPLLPPRRLPPLPTGRAGAAARGIDGLGAGRARAAARRSHGPGDAAGHRVNGNHAADAGRSRECLGARRAVKRHGFLVQVGAFRDATKAQKLCRGPRRKGL